MTTTIETPHLPDFDLARRPAGPERAATGFVADTWNVMVRELKPVFREPASVLFAMV